MQPPVKGGFDDIQRKYEESMGIYEGIDQKRLRHAGGRTRTLSGQRAPAMSQTQPLGYLGRSHSELAGNARPASSIGGRIKGSVSSNAPRPARAAGARGPVTHPS